MEGMTAYAPFAWIAAIGVVSGLVLMPLGFPVWFAVNCLFTDHILWPVDLSACRPLPDFPPTGWALAGAWFAGIGVGYVLLYRVSIRKGWIIRFGSAGIHPGHLFATAAAVTTGRMIATALTDPAVSLSESLVIIVSGPMWLRIWWSLRVRAYAFAAARRPAPVCVWTAKVFLARQFLLSKPDIVAVGASPHQRGEPHALPVSLSVKGPFDAVDARRIADLVSTRMHHMVTNVETETTLPEAEYRRPYEEELGPSGYQSPPIPPPLTIPTPLIWCAGALVIGYFGYVVTTGDPFSIGKERIEAAIESIGRDVEQMEAGLDPTKETGVDTSFYLINLRDSKDACPGLSRDVMGRWRIHSERFDDRYVYRVHQVSQIDFIGFVIDGISHTCVEEALGRNLREAQYRVASRFSAHEWIEIANDMDWRYVPPRAPSRR